MIRVHKVSAMPYGEAFLLTTQTEGLLIDSGCDYQSFTLAQKVEEILGNRPLRGILITHCHYDHICGCVGLKEVFPDAKVKKTADRS